MSDKKKMNVVQLTFMVAVNMMGSGIIMLPANMAGVGAISLTSWIVTAVGSMAIAYGFALLHGDNDHEKIRLETPLYDALYAWCQRQVAEGAGTR